MGNATESAKSSINDSNIVKRKDHDADSGIPFERICVAGKYDSTLWEKARQEKLQALVTRFGQTLLNSFMDIEKKNTISSEPIADSEPVKSRQISFTQGGELTMETNPDLEGMEVQDRPTDVIKDGEITNVTKGTKAEIFDLEDGQEPDYGQRDDQMLQIEVEVEHEDGTVEVLDSYRYYDSPSPSSNLGKFINRYEFVPNQGGEVKVEFDSEGRGSIRLE